jgi:protein SCO1/2
MAGHAMNETRMRRPHPIRALSLLLWVALPLAACSGPAPPARAPLEGAKIGGPFALTDQNGRKVTDRDFAGKYRIMYFGYTFCPDVCPTDAQNIGAGLRALEASDPALAAKIVPIFVTVDPARDTPAVLKAFVGAFHPRMVGLTGSPEAIDAVAKEFAVYYHKEDPTPGGGYMVDHSRVAYLMDPQGNSAGR